MCKCMHCLQYSPTKTSHYCALSCLSMHGYTDRAPVYYNIILRSSRPRQHPT